MNESFSPTANKWTTLAPLPQGTMYSGSVVDNGLLYCIGGMSSYLGTVLNNVQIYQP